jgi:hypothetical protein
LLNEIASAARAAQLTLNALDIIEEPNGGQQWLAKNALVMPSPVRPNWRAQNVRNYLHPESSIQPSLSLRCAKIFANSETHIPSVTLRLPVA